MKRIESIDILRGMTIALMILVNNPGSWTAVYPPLRHAAWNGFTPTDLVFPLFLFVMGVSMYFSFRKSGFRLSWKVLRRTLLLIGIGLALNWLGRLIGSHSASLAGLRLTGVLQRLGLCFGIGAVLVCTLNHKWLPWIALTLLGGYTVLLLTGNGYAYGAENLLSRVDRALIGEAHLYSDNGIDPEGLLSTIPSIAHTLTGFLVGSMVAQKKNRTALWAGIGLVAAGLALSPWLPLNKKIWSPSYTFFTCGLGTLLLCLLYWLLDEKRRWHRDGFFKAFGTNAIYCYVMSHLVAWLLDGTGLHGALMGLAGDSAFTSLLYALLCILLTWLTVLPLFRRGIFLKV